RERVEALIGAYRGNGLAVVGLDGVRRALEVGQIDELFIAGRPDALDPGAGSTPVAGPSERTAQERTADELIVKARGTAAKISVIEDASLLAAVGGVGATLRFKL